MMRITFQFKVHICGLVNRNPVERVYPLKKVRFQRSNHPTRPKKFRPIKRLSLLSTEKHRLAHIWAFLLKKQSALHPPFPPSPVPFPLPPFLSLFRLLFLPCGLIRRVLDHWANQVSPSAIGFRVTKPLLIIIGRLVLTCEILVYST
jgi:hypothetical protein